MPKILVCDVESTGLVGTNKGDLIVSIGISEVDLINHTVTPYFDEIIGYDTNKWPQMKTDSWIFENSPLGVPDVLEAYDRGATLENIATKFNNAIENRWIAFYNREFDYNKFLKYSPFNIDKKRVLPCLMLCATDPCAIPGYYGVYKWPRLEEAASILLEKDIKDELAKKAEFHTASYDTQVSGFIMLKMIEDGYYNIIQYLNQ